MLDRDTTVRKQITDFGSIYTRRYNVLSHISYVRASPMRVLSEALKRHLPSHRKVGLSVLDYGFGHGHALFRFGRLDRLHGIELSDVAIRAVTEKARIRGYANVDLRTPPSDDPVRIEYPADHFDVVICSHTIEHVHNDEGLLSELCRVLRPGGKCFLLVPTDVDHSGLLSEELERRNPVFPEKSFHAWVYNLPTFRLLTKIAGFDVIEAVSLDAIEDFHQRASRLAQIGSSLLFLVLPFWVWQWSDRIMQNYGYHCRQCLVVATKSGASAGNRGRIDAYRN